jgi:hypothetical protein
VEVDLTGSSPQVPTAFNVPFEGSTKVACFFALRALLLDTYTHQEYIPQNEGSFRPVKVTAPHGCIFNPIEPVAAEARFSQIQRVVDLIIKALAPVLPAKSTARNAAVLSFGAYSGVRPSGDYWVFLGVNEAATGGGHFGRSGLRTEAGDTITYPSRQAESMGTRWRVTHRKCWTTCRLITVDHARNDYSVVLDTVDDGYGWALNRAQTKGLRTTMKRGARASDLLRGDERMRYLYRGKDEGRCGRLGGLARSQAMGERLL